MKTLLRTMLLATLLLLLTTVTTVSAQSLPRDVRADILEAVVQIIPLGDDGPVDWSGSGTIISPSGYILTNYHVIGDTRSRQHYEWHVVSMVLPNASDQPPEPTFWARYVAADPTHDLAILKIVEYIDETPVPEDVRFTAMAVAGNESIMLGDDITVVGFPGISGATITYTRGIMSGWLGEDFESGGRQWIKTDAKISHGNSGGAAFNIAGELIGVPTAGRSVAYEELDVEEQAYVRPIGLAWSLIGPHVPDVRRAGSSIAQPPTPTPQPPSPAITTPQTTSIGDPSGSYGTVALNSSVTGVLAPVSGDDTLTYHTYSLDIPAGLSSIHIAIDAGGSDVDMAVKYGSEIQSYSEDEGDYDYLDFSTEANPSYTWDNPQAGTYYIDVVSLLEEDIRYELRTTSAGGSSNNPLNPLNPAPNPANPQNALAGSSTIQASSSESGVMGTLASNGQARGSLAGIDDEGTYHTYRVDVPAGTRLLTISLNASMDLDLFAKAGSEISSYNGDEGDWQYRDIETSNNATFRIANPQAGVWYVDVVSFLGTGNVSDYELDIRSQ